MADRPTLIRGSRQLLFGGMGHLNENCVLNIKNKSHAVTAEVVIPNGGASGVILNQGGFAGGWSFYLQDGKPKTATTCSGCSSSTLRPTARSPRAPTSCGWSSPTTAAAWARAAPAPYILDGEQVGQGRVKATQPIIFSGNHRRRRPRPGSQVTTDYGTDNAFSGQIDLAQVDLNVDDYDDLIAHKNGAASPWPDNRTRKATEGLNAARRSPHRRDLNLDRRRQAVVRVLQSDAVTDSPHNENQCGLWRSTTTAAIARPVGIAGGLGRKRWDPPFNVSRIT